MIRLSGQSFQPLCSVLVVGFGPLTTESKNIKNCAHFDLGDLFRCTSSVSWIHVGDSRSDKYFWRVDKDLMCW